MQLVLLFSSPEHGRLVGVSRYHAACFQQLVRTYASEGSTLRGSDAQLAFVTMMATADARPWFTVCILC